MSTTKRTEYFLNGKQVDKETVKKRKGVIKSTTTITQRYYVAPLTEEEKKKAEKDAINASNYFTKMREDREELEKRHG